MEQQKISPNDVYELTRGELDGILAYLAEKPAKEVYNLINGLLVKRPVRMAPVEEVPAPAVEAPLVPEETQTTEQ